MRLTIVVCNVCQRRDMPTEQYELKHGTQRIKVDLCVDHAGPVEELMQIGRDAGAATSSRSVNNPGQTQRGRGGRRPQVHTLEEIEALRDK